MNALRGRLKRLAMEPPFRLFVRAVLKGVPVSVSTRALWDISDRPRIPRRCAIRGQAGARERVGEISAIEFGVAGGNGLLALEREAEAVEKELGVSIKVYGFDNGPAGLPAFIGDHRDHPDKWKPGDFPMDEALLRSKLGPRTTLVLGNVEETVPRFFDDPSVPPVGFVAFDLDLYSSTTDALRMLSMPGQADPRPRRALLRRHRSLHQPPLRGRVARNRRVQPDQHHIKIDRWRGLKTIGPSRRRRSCRRCIWPTTSSPSLQGLPTGALWTVR